MKIKIFICIILINNTLFAQTITSYKFCKEYDNGNTVFAGRILASVATEYTKTLSTVFVFDAKLKTIKIGDKLWHVTGRDGNKYFASNKGRFCKINLFAYGNDAIDDQITIAYYNKGEDMYNDPKYRYRYYFKHSKWRFPSDY